MQIKTMTADETYQVGLTLGLMLQAGDCICLQGTLGAGKTLLAQGIAWGLGVTEPVTSPTFTILQLYQGRVPLFHYDLYRLTRPQELFDIGFEEYGGTSGVTLIEWPDLLPDYMPEALWIKVDVTGVTERTLSLATTGGRYDSLVKELKFNDSASN